MDVRYSAEQRALRDAAAQLVDRLGPRAGGQLGDGERAAKLDAGTASGVDLTRPTVQLSTTSASVLAGQSRAITEDDLRRWTALGLAVTGADLVGTMRGAVDLTVEYAKQRRQYGQPIGSFQAVQ